MVAPGPWSPEREAVRDLVRAALRMWPDRILAGEAQGEPTFKLLESPSGPDGSFLTIHANGPVSFDPLP